jgi:hypothetical protein
VKFEILNATSAKLTIPYGEARRMGLTDPNTMPYFPRAGWHVTTWVRYLPPSGEFPKLSAPCITLMYGRDLVTKRRSKLSKRASRAHL